MLKTDALNSIEELLSAIVEGVATEEVSVSDLVPVVSLIQSRGDMSVICLSILMMSLELALRGKVPSGG